jgi:hypothetical protein
MMQTLESGGTSRRPAVTSVGTVLRWCVAGLMLGSAGIHFGMMGEHAGISWTHGTFFAAAAWVQLGIAVLVILRPTRPVLVGAAAVNLGILAVWLVDRTAGIAIGGDGTPAKFTSIDITCAVFEGLAVVLLLALLSKSVERRPLSAGVGFAGVALVGLLVAALTGYVFSPAAASDGNGGTASDGHNHSHAAAGTSPDGHNHGGGAAAPGQGGLVDAGASGVVVTGALTGKSPCELSGPPASSGQVGQDAEGHSHRGPLLQESLTREETLALQAEQARARAVALRYPTVASAEAAGYRKSTEYVPCIGAHYTNTRLAVGFNVDTPSELLYDGTTPDAKIVGLSYLVFHLNGPPEGFTGPNDHWHQHNLNGGLCMSKTNGVVIGAESTSEAECAARGGRKVPLDDIWMVHDWVVPGFECSWGVFAGECPELGGRVGGTAWDPPAKGSAGDLSSQAAGPKS